MIDHIDAYAALSGLPTECLLPAGYSWELARDLRIEVQTSEQEIVALACLAGEEYGIGSDLKEAVYDLLTLMSRYLDALQSRENLLSESATAEMKVLRGQIRRNATLRAWALETFRGPSEGNWGHRKTEVPITFSFLWTFRGTVN